jgi:thioredoxin reductase (NADPH)
MEKSARARLTSSARCMDSLNWKLAMNRPILLAIDDDINVLEAVVQDLRRQYGATYRVLARRQRTGGPRHPAAVEGARRGRQPAAERPADAGNDGRRVSGKGAGDLSRAKRVLLTAYADTEAAIRAINTARIHYYLTKPWDPPEEKLYPVLDDLLQDWNAGYQPKFEGLRVIGHRWSLKDHQLRSFLSRNHVPYRWLDAAASDDAQQLLKERSLDPEVLPVVLFADGSALVDPEQECWRRGLACAPRRRRISTTLLSSAQGRPVWPLRYTALRRTEDAGHRTRSSRRPGRLFVADRELSRLPSRHHRRRPGTAGAHAGRPLWRRVPDPAGGRPARRRPVPVCCAGRWPRGFQPCPAAFNRRAVRRLEIPGADQLTGRGIYYGAALVEAAACKDEDVFIVGGANSAGQAALHFAKFACKVTMLVRASGLEASMSKYLIDEIERTSNIVVEPNTQVLELKAKIIWKPCTFADRREKVVGRRHRCSFLLGLCRERSGFRNRFCATKRDLFSLARIFPVRQTIEGLSGPTQSCRANLLEFGRKSEPRSCWKRSVPGVFVAGDVRHGSVKRAASAVGEGSIAVQFAHQYLASF